MRLRTLALASSVVALLACDDSPPPTSAPNHAGIAPVAAAAVTDPTGPATNECSAAQSSWIFCDDFEQDRTGKYFEYDNASGKFVRSTGNGVNGSTSMRATYTKGQTGAGYLHLAFGRTPSATFKPVDAGTANYRELYWRVWVRKQSGWTGDGPSKLTRATILAKSDWSQAMFAHFWSDENNTKYMLMDPATGVDANGNVVTSGYNDFNHMTWLGSARSDSTYDDNAHANKWICYEFHVKLNDAGQSNAVDEMYVNGRLSAKKTGFNWVGKYNAYGINAVFLEQYWNGGAPATESRDLDNFVVSTQPIGCGNSGSTVPPVQTPGVASITVSPANSTLNAGQTVQLTAKDLDATGTPVTGATNTWSSSNTAVATVSSTGLVTAVAAGTATITAANGSVSGKTTITVTATSTDPTGPVTAECSSMKTGWIFCDDFEQDRTGKYFEYDNASGKFVRSAGNGVNGSTSMRATYTAGQTGAGYLHLAFGRTPSATFRPVDAGTANYRELYWRVYVRKQAGWTGDGPSKLTRATILAKSDWSQAMFAHFWSDENNTKYMLMDPATGVDANGNVVTSGYNDFNHMTWLGGVRSDSTYDDNAHANKWICYEFHVKLNDAGQSNAVDEMYVNGRLSARKTGFNWVGKYNAYGINAVFLEQYWNGGAAANESRDLDNFVVSTQPIGCGNGGSTPSSPSTPPAQTPVVTSVTVTPSAPSITTGQTTQLAATSIDQNGATMSGQSVSWSSSNTSAATVSSSGVVTGVAAGSATIKATNGSVSGSTTVTVSAPAVTPKLTTIAVSPSTASLTSGQTSQLSASDLDQNGKAMSVTNSWSSSNTSVATVSAGGLVTAVAAGSATITAASGTVSGKATITVTAPATTPPSSGTGGANNPNEPAGFTMIADRAFNSLATSSNKTSTAAEGWDPSEESQWSDISIISDPTAPRSPNNVLQALYPKGVTGGDPNATPGRIVKNFNSAQQVYVSMWVKLSNNWVGNGTGTNKVFYIWMNNSPYFFMSAEGSGSGTLNATGRYQGSMDSREAFPPNLASGSPVTRGQWQHWEILVKANTPGVSNGEFHLWVNGTKVSQYTNIGYLKSSESMAFMKMDVEPIWGGLGSTLAADQYMYFDHVYVSAK